MRVRRSAGVRTQPGGPAGAGGPPRRERGPPPHRPRDGALVDGRPGHQRLSAPGAPAAPVCRPRLRLRPHERAPEPRPARRRRLVTPPGHRWEREPVPVLPADRGRSDPLRGVRRRLPLREQDGALPRATPVHVPHAGPALRGHVPAARRRPVHPFLGGRHRHLLPLLRLLRPLPPRTGGVGHRLHRVGGRSVPLRRPGDAGSAVRGADRVDATPVRPQEAAPLPARAPSLGRHRADPLVDGPSRRARGRRNLWLRALDRLGMGFDS